MAIADIPQWVKDKIVPLTLDGHGIDIKDAPFFTQVWVNPVTHKFRFTKQGNAFCIYNHETFTNSGDRSFRIQFDLLIDSD